ncbi:hypothetical protein H3146_00050 [Streptomyces sp. OF3]|uniref:Uncharacterized protein n=1 Tax=Streptomyces alkaliterrae TaxID=2213162 RepID=A0A7W3WG46_9ACTN|nr:hypothetical protein [Streptomyces alkaliterrae]MBB1251763.1 hypothetical protein [Streptomyces alkaliterrae]
MEGLDAEARQRLADEGAEQIEGLLAKVEAIRAQVLEVTGQELVGLPPRRADILDATWAELADLGERTQHAWHVLLLVAPSMMDAPQRRLSAVLKTVDPVTAAKVRWHLEPGLRQSRCLPVSPRQRDLLSICEDAAHAAVVTGSPKSGNPGISRL